MQIRDALDPAGFLFMRARYCPCHGRCHKTKYPCSFSCLMHPWKTNRPRKRKK